MACGQNKDAWTDDQEMVLKATKVAWTAQLREKKHPGDQLSAELVAWRNREIDRLKGLPEFAVPSEGKTTEELERVSLSDGYNWLSMLTSFQSIRKWFANKVDQYLKKDIKAVQTKATNVSGQQQQKTMNNRPLTAKPLTVKDLWSFKRYQSIITGKEVYVAENQDEIKEKSKTMTVKDGNEGGKVKAAETALWNGLSDSEKEMYKEKAKGSNMYANGCSNLCIKAHSVWRDGNVIVGTLESVIQDICLAGRVQSGMEFHVKAAWRDASGGLETKM
jgi:hypothetical protein